jgi:5-methylcytosine-specific restriction endonuclease McrA
MYIPKPGKVRKPAVRSLRDGREVCRTRAAWDKRRLEVWKRDRERCVFCTISLRLSEAHIDHVKKRGMSGGTRDDRPENLRTLCEQCHRERHVFEEGL